MSWIRFAGTCEGVGSACSHQPDGACPGSDVYVFDNSDGYIECCGCVLARSRRQLAPWLKSVDEMYAHLREHVAAGHHVPMRYLSPEADAACLDVNVGDDALIRACAKGDPDGILKPVDNIMAKLAEALGPALNKPLRPNNK